jgi:hypothetical protein
MGATPKDTIKQIEYYAAALKAPRIRDSLRPHRGGQPRA